MRELFRDWCPPAVLRWLRDFRKSGAIELIGPFASWDEAKARCGGYDDRRILIQVLEAALKVQRGEAVFERDSVVFDQADYVWPLLAGLLWAAARSGGRLSVLDFGGSLGSTYFQHRAFLQGLPSVCWGVVEQLHYVEAGRSQIREDTLTFHSSIDDSIAWSRPNVIILSSVLQYLCEPLAIVKKLAKLPAEALLIDRTPFVEEGPARLMVQKVPRSIYAASYPMWIFSKTEVLDVLATEGWHVLESHGCPEGRAGLPGGGAYSFDGLMCVRRS